MIQMLYKPSKECAPQSAIFKCIEETLWQFPSFNMPVPGNQPLEFFIDCIFHNHQNLGLCRDATASYNQSIRHIQACNITKLESLISEVTGRSISVFDLIESLQPTKAATFPIVNLKLVFEWFLSEVVSGGGFSKRDEQAFFCHAEKILSENSSEIDLADSKVVSSGVIKLLDRCPIANGFYSYVLLEPHIRPSEIELKVVLDKLFEAALDTSYEFIVAK